MVEISKIERVVKQMLINNPSSRDNDKRLYVFVCKAMGLNIDVSLRDWCKTAKYPNTETVKRCRRRMQEKYPELQATEWTASQRMREAAQHKKYFKRIKNVK